MDPKLNPNKFEVLARGESTVMNIYGEIGFEVEAADIIQGIANTSTPELNVHLNSAGGSAADGVAIYNRLREFSGTVNTVVDGGAWSAASVIALAGEKREMRSGSTIMIHNAWTVTMGDDKAHLDSAKMLKGFNEDLANIYSERTNLDHAEALALMAEETWIRQDEALDHGFITSHPLAMAAMYCKPSDKVRCFYHNMPDDVCGPQRKLPAPDPEVHPKTGKFRQHVESVAARFGTTPRNLIKDLAIVACAPPERVAAYLDGQSHPLADADFRSFSRLPGFGNLVDLKHLARQDGVRF